MAEIIQQEKSHKGGKKKPKKHSTAIDMTPMVDLMCLLITFFMLTTAFSKPKVMEIVLPDKPKPGDSTPPSKIDTNRALTIILGNDHSVYYYKGKAVLTSQVYKTDFSDKGIREILLERNKELYMKINDLKESVKKSDFKIEKVMPKGKLDDLRKTLRENEIVNKYVEEETKKMKKEDDLGPVVLIKAEEETKYKDFVDIIDEMAISNVARYAIVDMQPVEKEMIAKSLPKP
jgi:biopolymer transport protein ExbD